MAAMTFLQLVQRLREKSGSVGTGPTAVTAQTGESLRLVNWVNEAWTEIQARSPHWKWMRKDFSFQTAASKIFYLPTITAGEVGIADFGRWHDQDTFRMYRTSLGRADEQYLVPWDYQTFRDSYDFGIQSTILNRPSVWAERDKDQAILLGPTPDAIYTVTGQYQASPSVLAADADLPGLPAEFHMLIVYKALMLYAEYEAAAEVFSANQKAYDRMYSMLEDDQLEGISFGAPLA